MKVTPVGKKFGSYRPGDKFDLHDRAARHLVKAGLLAEASDDSEEIEISPRTGRPKRQYTRRDMKAEA